MYEMIKTRVIPLLDVKDFPISVHINAPIILLENIPITSFITTLLHSQILLHVAMKRTYVFFAFLALIAFSASRELLKHKVQYSCIIIKLACVVSILLTLSTRK